MPHEYIGVDATPFLTEPAIAALYGLRKSARLFAVVQGRKDPQEVIVQADDGRSWLVTFEGAAHRCDDLPSPHRDKPYPRHPLVDLGCPRLGCAIRVPLTAEGIPLLSYAVGIASQRTSDGIDARRMMERLGRDGIVCPEHEVELVEVARELRSAE